jgi:hypothetical protein
LSLNEKDEKFDESKILEKVKIIEKRRPTKITSTISDERGEELMYNKKLISTYAQS